MSKGGEKGTVCVTGGTGFVGSWLIKTLLHQGYSVHTTIRPHHHQGHNRDNISFLTELPGAKDRLKLFNADLNDPATFSAAIRGCSGVFHVATPVDFERKEDIETIVERSVKGALGIVKACLESKTVRRVVYTSSASTVTINGVGEEVTAVMDESYWTDVDYVRALDSDAGSYVISKTLTERKVMEFADGNGMELVTVVPSFVVGPFVCPKFPGSVRNTLALLLGTVGDNGQFPVQVNTSMVHIDDVARAHIFLLENPETTRGRFICSSHTVTLEQIHQLLTTRYPEFPLPTLESLKQHINSPKEPGLSSKKLLDAGFEFKYGVEDMFDGAIQCCKLNGYL